MQWVLKPELSCRLGSTDGPGRHTLGRTPTMAGHEGMTHSSWPRQATDPRFTPSSEKRLRFGPVTRASEPLTVGLIPPENYEQLEPRLPIHSGEIVLPVRSWAASPHLPPFLGPFVLSP